MKKRITDLILDIILLIIIVVLTSNSIQLYRLHREIKLLQSHTNIMEMRLTEMQAHPNKLFLSQYPFPEPLGEYTITFYCDCDKCCGIYSSDRTASGTIPQAHYTCAAEGFPIGTQLYIRELGEIVVVEDRFGDPSITHKIDIFVNNHDEALQLGVLQSEVYMI